MSTTAMTSTLNHNKFAWLLKREFWEYRGGFFMAPMITTLVMLAITLIALFTAEFAAQQHGVRLGGMNLDRVVENIGAGEVAKVHAAIDMGLIGMSAPIGIVFCFVVFFYLLGALYNDRADRSVLFWKSLPLSDTETVLSKVAMAALIAPVLAVAAMIALHLGFLILLSLYSLVRVGPHALTLLWSPTHLLALWFKMLVLIPVNAIWALPTIGWLLLCSSYVRSKPFLWAVLMPVLAWFLIWWTGALRIMSISSSWFWSEVIGRLLFSHVPLTWLSQATLTDTFKAAGDGDDIEIEVLNHLLSFDHIAQALAMPNLWIGAAAGAAMIAAAIWFRRSRIESYA